jgi:hypothetical protein
VYAAIARIGVSGVDTNPEPGYNLGYQMDLNTGMPTRSAAVYSLASRNIGTFGRVAIKLEIGGAWVWASFDSFSQNPHRYLMPTKTNGLVQQRYVNNLHIFTSVSKKNDIKSGKSARGNLEVWASDTSPRNQLKIPDAQDGSFDWGDRRKIKGFSGCFQVHDFMQHQVLIAVNNLFKQDKHDIGLGNQPMVTNGATKKFVQPDWTGANNFLGHKRRKSKMLLSWYFQKPQAKPKSPKTATHTKKG